VWNAQQAGGAPGPITFVSVDINNLKIINDQYGHKNGDQLLCEMASLLKKHFSGEQYAVFRTGGDEFLILGRGVDGEQMGAAMERLAAEAATVYVNDLPISFGYGMCTQAPGEFDFDDGLRMSDLQLLEKKNLFHGRTAE
jgi:diguanylate cyclase (GGDEF)-like protein